MTTRNRTIFNQEELFVSNITGAGLDGAVASGEVTVLSRIQSTNYDESVSRTDVQEFGKLSRLGSIIVEPPSVSLSFDYLLADGFNETGIGLVAEADGSVNALSGILAGLPQAEKNFYVMTTQPGLDAHGVNPQSSSNQFFNFGNCFLTNYSVSLAVGELPSASTSWECSNLVITTGGSAGFTNPAIITTGQGAPDQYDGLVTLPIGSTGSLSVIALRPGDIIVDFGNDSLQVGGAVLPGSDSEAGGKTAISVQSVNIEIPLSRTPMNSLGSYFAKSRELDVPITATLNVSANLRDIDDGNLLSLICEDEATRTITVTLNNPCGLDGVNMKYEFKGAIFDSQNFGNAVGDNAKTVELTFSAQMGGGNDQSRGVFITRSS